MQNDPENGPMTSTRGKRVLSAQTWLAALAAAALLLSAARTACSQIPSDALLDRLARTVDKSQAVHDLAGVLSAEERQALDARCKALREKNGAALVVIILPSLEGGQIDDFTNKLYSRLGIGDRQRDDGVLLVVAMQDRKARIETGYGIEPIVPDTLAGRILDERLFPAFKQQQYARGLQQAVDELARLIERGEPAPPEARGANRPPGDTIAIVLIFCLFIAVGSLFFGAGLRHVIPRPAYRVANSPVASGDRAAGWFLMLFGGPFVGIPYLLGWFLAAPWAPLIHTPLALVCGSFGFWGITPGTLKFPRTPTGSGGTSGSSTWWSDWTQSTSGGSSSWGGGGFSSDWGGFGGGSSGGGGASGGW